jgi:hypothetical protein
VGQEGKGSHYIRVEENELQRASDQSDAGKRQVNRNHKFLSWIEKSSKLRRSAHPNDVDRDVNSPSPKAHGRFSFMSCKSVQKIVGPEPSLGVFRQNIRRKIKYWMDNQHLTM